MTVKELEDQRPPDFPVTAKTPSQASPLQLQKLLHTDIATIHEPNCNTSTMTSIRRMSPTDLFSLNLTNLDPLTENYDLGFYLNYLMRWPSLFSSVKDRREGIAGYSMLSFCPFSCSPIL